MNQLSPASLCFNERALSLSHQIDGRFTPLNRQELADLESEIDVYVRERLSSQPNSGPEKEDTDQARLTIQTTKETAFPLDWGDQALCHGNLNLICPQMPPALMGVNNMLKVSFIGSYDIHGYHFSNSNSLIRLHPAQAEKIPQEVIAAMGDTKGKKVEYYSSVEDISDLMQLMRQQNKPLVLNLASHPWAHPHYKFGSDVTHNVDMGIFCAQNVYQVASHEGVQFDEFKPLPVTCHPTNEGLLAFSPNNALFGVTDNRPVSSFWAVFKFENRSVAIKHILINTKDSLGREMGLSFSNSPNINEATNEMKRIKSKEEHSLFELADAFEHNPEFAVELFGALPAYQQNSCYYQTWVDKWPNKQTPPPHRDFGKASFHCFGDLGSQFHCSNSDKAMIVRNYAIRLGDELNKVIQDTETLFAPSQEIPPRSQDQIEKIKLLTPVAEAFGREDEEEGFRLFNQLDSVHRHGVFQYVWDEKGSPTFFEGDFGRASFYGTDSRLGASDKCMNSQRKSAILYYMYSV